MHFPYKAIFIIKFCMLVQPAISMQNQKLIMPDAETKELINEINLYKNGGYRILDAATLKSIKQKLSIYRIKEAMAATIDSSSRYMVALCSDFETFKLLTQNNIINPSDTIYIGAQKKTSLTDLSFSAPFYISQTGGMAIQNPRLFFSLQSPNEKIRKVLFWIKTYPQLINESLYLDERGEKTFLAWALQERQLVITHLLVRNGAYKLNSNTKKYNYQPLLMTLASLEQDKRSCGIENDYRLDELKRLIYKQEEFQKNRHFGACTLYKRFRLLPDLYQIIHTYCQSELES